MIKTKKFKTLDIDRDKNFKPAKVDLLIYYKIYHEKESNYLNYIFTQKNFEQRIKSSDFKRFKN